jgi:hypothetical protein
MSAGHRVLIFTWEKVISISQRAFEAFLSRVEATLKLYANRIINVAVVRYTLKNRKPDQVIAIETTRLKVDENGMCDSDYMNNYKRLVVNRLPVWSFASNNDDNIISTSKNVADATSRFKQKE